MNDLELLTVEQVAELVQLSPSTVMRAIRAGELEASQLAPSRGGWRVREAAIGAWLDVRSNRSRHAAGSTVVPMNPAGSPPASRGARASRAHGRIAL